MQAQHAGLFDGFRHILPDGVAAGEFPPNGDVDLVLGMIWGEYTHVWRYAFSEGATREQTVDRLIRKLQIIMRGLAAS